MLIEDSVNSGKKSIYKTIYNPKHIFSFGYKIVFQRVKKRPEKVFITIFIEQKAPQADYAGLRGIFIGRIQSRKQWLTADLILLLYQLVFRL